VSDKNPNAKLKRWKGIIDDHGAKVIYKPGKENLVADALSKRLRYPTPLKRPTTRSTASEIRL